MKYLGLTQATAAWLQSQPVVRDELVDFIGSPAKMEALSKGILTAGPLRLAGSSDKKVAVVWNADYLTGAGEEAWGFMRIAQYLGVLDHEAIQLEVFERCLAIIDRRLQGLRLDSAFIHRAHPNGSHTCVAGRGDVARSLSLGYWEGSGDGSRRRHSLLCVGPHRDFALLAKRAEEESRELPELVQISDRLLSSTQRLPVLESDSFASLRRSSALSSTAVVPNVHATGLETAIPGDDAYATLGWTFEEWTGRKERLSDAQRRILESAAVKQHPIRILGPAGSGKTLIMQLLAFKLLKEAESADVPLRVFYVTHNLAMASKVSMRFETLGGADFLAPNATRCLSVGTLAGYATDVLDLQSAMIVDSDAEQTKVFQFETVKQCMKNALSIKEDLVRGSSLLTTIASTPSLFDAFCVLAMWEISNVIKGHGLVDDERRYVAAEKPYSRLHGILVQQEREFLFEGFRLYHQEIFEKGGVLDNDDIAISLLGRLRTPVWQLKRKELGFDYVFVDEGQLFNENERRLFPLLTRGIKEHTPIALAMDLAQEPFGQINAGLARLGITAVEDATLPTIHRSTQAIVRLAFFIIQKTTDLFGVDFPDFTKASEALILDKHRLAAHPRFERYANGTDLATAVANRVQNLRSKNLRQIAVICHADEYWPELLENLPKRLPIGEASEFILIDRRGISIGALDPVVALSKPRLVGGQEFDAVIAVGLEEGLMPPRVFDNAALGVALEQRALREMYLSITRARYRVEILLGPRAKPTSVLSEAVGARLIQPPPAAVAY